MTAHIKDSNGSRFNYNGVRLTIEYRIWTSEKWSKRSRRSTPLVMLTPFQIVQCSLASVTARGSMAALTTSQLWRPSCTLELCITLEKLPLRRIQSRWCSRHGGSGKRHLFERLAFDLLRPGLPRRWASVGELIQGRLHRRQSRRLKLD